MPAPSFQNPYLTAGIWSEWLLVSFLILTGVIYWIVSKRMGFQILFLTVLSLSFGIIITMYFPYLYTDDRQLPLTHPHIQASMTLFSIFIPLVKKRTEVVLCLVPPLMISISYLFFQQTPVFSIVGGILIGGFISYMYYRSLDWMGAMPEPYLFAFAIIIPLFIAGLIYPASDFLVLPGILLGAGTGVTLEQFKVRAWVGSSNVTAKLLSLSLGIFGLVMGYMLFSYISLELPLSYMGAGLAAGLWITFFVPLLLLSTKLYEQQGKRREIF